MSWRGVTIHRKTPSWEVPSIHAHVVVDGDGDDDGGGGGVVMIIIVMII